MAQRTTPASTQPATKTPGSRLRTHHTPAETMIPEQRRRYHGSFSESYPPTETPGVSESPKRPGTSSRTKARRVTWRNPRSCRSNCYAVQHSTSRPLVVGRIQDLPLVSGPHDSPGAEACEAMRSKRMLRLGGQHIFEVGGIFEPAEATLLRGSLSDLERDVCAFRRAPCVFPGSWGLVPFFTKSLERTGSCPLRSGPPRSPRRKAPACPGCGCGVGGGSPVRRPPTGRAANRAGETRP